jgi:uncharacterized protein (DUF1501 family)
MQSTAMNRRELLQAASAMPALGLLSGNAFRGRGAVESRAFVLLQLRGGNDGLNTVIPFEDDAYYRARPTLGLPKSKLHRIDELNALHPALGRLRRWYEQGSVSIVQSVGYQKSNLSHFRGQDIWDSCDLDGRDLSSGWLGRWLDAERRRGRADELSMLAIGRDILPTALRSLGDQAPCFARLENFRIRGGEPEDSPRSRVAAIDKLNAQPSANARIAYVQRTASAARTASERLVEVGQRPTRVDFPQGELGVRLRTAAQILASDLGTRVIHVTFDGFDTHTDQLRDHAAQLGQLDEALDAFLGELKAQGILERTLILTVSEFGRRVAESGIGSDAGTDHGAGSLLLAIGGGVRGGVHGGQPDLEDLDRNGNLHHRIDFRQVYASVVADWIGGNPAEIVRGKFETVDFLA